MGAKQGNKYAVGNKGGRPKKEIDQRVFESLCGIQCTQTEVCAVLDCDDKTLTKWCKETYNMSFSDVFAEKRKSGLVSLRRMQWKHAERNPAMAMFLGKNYLGQTDKQDITHAGSMDINITGKVKDWAK